MAATSKLTMTCEVTPITSQDTGGNPVYGTKVSGVKCFAFGQRRRSMTNEVTEFPPTFQILFLPTANVDLNFKIENVKTHRDESVLVSGVVVSVEKNYHPKKGLVLQQVSVERR